MTKQPIEFVLDLRSSEEILEEIRPYIPKGLKVRHSEAHEKDTVRGGSREYSCASCGQRFECDMDYELQKDMGWDITAFTGVCRRCDSLNMTLEVSVFPHAQILEDGIFDFKKFNNFSTGYVFTEKAACSIGNLRWEFRRENFLKVNIFTIDRHIIGPTLVRVMNFNSVSIAAVRLFKKIHPSIVFMREYYQCEFDI